MTLSAKTEIKYKEVNGTSYHEETPEQIVSVLESCRTNNRRIRLFYGDTKSGLVWPEECDVIGTLGRSTGRYKVPLLLKTERSTGGGAILDHCIVGIKFGNVYLYKHPSFNTGRWECQGLSVLHNGNLHATFKTEERAAKYCAFMKG